MKLLRSSLDKFAPLFEKGGKLEKMYPAYEAADTFLYTPGEVTEGPSHVRDGMDLKRMMTLVIVALIPAIFMACYNTGYQANRALTEVLAADAVESRQAYAVEAERTLDALPAGTLADLGAEDFAALSAAPLVQQPAEEIEAAAAPILAVKTEELEAAILGDGEPTAEQEAELETALAARAAVDKLVQARVLEVPHVEGWRGWVMEGLGLGPDPDSFLANFLHGLLWFLPLYLVTVVVGGTAEAIFSTIRGHEINEGFLVTSMLFPLTLPATTPLWQAALGILFGVVIGKEVFGGTGKNFLNPAMTSRAFLYFAYPAQITGDKVWNAATGTSEAAYDAYSSATTLNTMSTMPRGSSMADLIADKTHVDWWDAFLGFIEGSMGETSALAALIGAAILIGVGVGAWRIMAGCVVGLLAFDTLLWLIVGDGLAWLGIREVAGVGDPTAMYPMYNIPPWYHLVVGGFAFGAVFMATDPVSSTWTKAGHWWYGILVGVVTVLIRVVNPAYPEGIMLAVLFGNVFAPLIDHFVVQRNINRRLARAKATTARPSEDYNVPAPAHA
ncbi:NADH:ubiquinone reductase (Na(+)-transporting) subunit B [Alienimonas californiensis]|uniref:Na(+)-translocating NADH-quinone reductase subunit B n=1 Tax=Alienimonas californiensis TaxID=2527989 RepID=A0A517PBF3_9PLAN|nr:NADH:ubiquinone reductase (Na(+)-transporting) subunit B [Alienimonas californiensis]QDT16707.1 Na(+)-translocating NADH-quinone reductase subunit B [Alienimonas californiensis]